MGMGNESAGNLSPAPPQWTKGPGVSAGRNYRLTDACPTVVSFYLRKVDAARSIGARESGNAGKSAVFSHPGQNVGAEAGVAHPRLLSSIGRQKSRLGGDR